jgi:hypothetical protein
MSVSINNLRVQVGLNQGPLNDITAITWTDITSSVILREGINFSTGKTFADRVARPGTLSLTLDNSAQKGTAGRWTVGGPNVTSGFNLRIPIRVGYYNGSSIDALWTGYIDLLSSRWDGGVRPVVQVTASDRLSRLARNNVGNRYVDEILADSPAGYWPLDDQGGDLAFNRGSYGFGVLRKARYSYFSDGDGAILLGTDPAIKMGADSPKVAYSATSPFGNGQYLQTFIGDQWQPSGHFTETFELMVNPTDIGTAGYNSLFTVTGTRDRHLGSLGAYISNGQLVITSITFPGAFSSSAQQYNATSSQAVFTANKWHHVAVTQTSTTGPNSTTLTGYVNGVQVCTVTFGLTGYASPTQFMTGNASFIVGGYGEPQVAGTNFYEFAIQSCSRGYLSNFAYHTSVLSSARLTEHANLVNGFSGEASTARFNRICGYAGLPAASYTTVGTSASTMSAQPMVDNGVGRNLLDMVNEVVDSEVGDVVAKPNGTLAFYSRLNRYNPSTAWSMTAQSVNADNGFDIDHTEVVNTARLTNGDGTVANSKDATSVGLYDTQSIDSNCYVNTTGQLEAIAYGLSHRSSSPKPRLRNISVDFVTWPSGSATDPYTVLTSSILDVFQVTGLPSASSPTTTLRLFIEGWSDRITESSWQRTFNASQVSAAFDPVWKLGTSVLDTSTVLAM